MDDNTIDAITKKVLAKLADDRRESSSRAALGASKSTFFSVGVSARHVHLGEGDLDTLFGPSHRLRSKAMLKQPGQFAAEETVAVVGSKRALYGVRVLGPVRGSTQVELSMSDCFHLGLKPMIRNSGDLAGTPGAIILGPAGSLELREGVIVAARHLHIEPSRAKSLGLENGQLVNVRVNPASKRSLLFEKVLVRSGDAHAGEFHVDTDEANAAAIKNGDQVEVVT